MGEKVDVKKEANENKIDVDGTKKVDEGPITVVLKLDLHCDGCAKKVKKSVRYIEGVKSVKADTSNNKLTITGKVNPVHIKERVEFKTKKKVEILSPKPNKDDGSGDKKADGKPAETKSNDQKPKEPQSTTVELKIQLHCDGCIQKIKRIISKIDGIDSVRADGNKNLVTVKGTTSMKEHIPYLKDKLKRNVDIVPPKKEDNKGVEKKDEKKDEKKVEGGEVKKEKEGNNDGDNKKNDTGKGTSNSEGDEKKKNNEEKSTSGGNEKKPDDKAKTDGDDGDESKNVDITNRFDYYRHSPYTYTMPVYNQTYHNQDYGVSVFSSHGYAMRYPHGPPPPPSPMSLHNPTASENDIFNADNPNACSIM